MVSAKFVSQSEYNSIQNVDRYQKYKSKEIEEIGFCLENFRFFFGQKKMFPYLRYNITAFSFCVFCNRIQIAIYNHRFIFQYFFLLLLLFGALLQFYCQLVRRYYKIDVSANSIEKLSLKFHGVAQELRVIYELFILFKSEYVYYA